jgi:hypothetical protein
VSIVGAEGGTEAYQQSNCFVGSNWRQTRCLTQRSQLVAGSGGALSGVILPGLIYDFRSYPPSIAASNERIVSSGLSQRDLVGLDRSGSAMGLPYASLCWKPLSPGKELFAFAAMTDLEVKSQFPFPIRTEARDGGTALVGSNLRLCLLHRECWVGLGMEPFCLFFVVGLDQLNLLTAVA